MLCLVQLKRKLKKNPPLSTHPILTHCIQKWRRHMMLEIYLTHLFTETENNGGRFSSETIFLITRHGKKKNDKDETGNVLLNLICFYPSIA
jgi:hypothetical protein